MTKIDKMKKKYIKYDNIVLFIITFKFIRIMTTIVIQY